MFGKILVPLDGSQLAERALKPALALARSAKGEVYLLQVTQPQEMLVPHHGGGYAFFWPDQSQERAADDARNYLETVLDTYVDPAVAIFPLLEQGDPASMIVDIAHNEDVDLVVMSSHGYTGFSRWLLGSTAEKVVRSSDCPVLIVRDLLPMQNILITLDGSPLAEKILLPAFTIAKAFEAKITLLRIGQHTETLNMRQVAEVERIEPGMGSVMLENHYRHDEMYLNTIAIQYESFGVPVNCVTLKGNPAEHIIGVAEQYDIDLVAMSTHGRTGLRRWVYGSITEKILHSMNKSMLIVRPSDEHLN
jgi:nucleotide-binding universal stress UspA family protein